MIPKNTGSKVKKLEIIQFMIIFFRRYLEWYNKTQVILLSDKNIIKSIKKWNKKWFQLLPTKTKWIK